MEDLGKRSDDGEFEKLGILLNKGRQVVVEANASTYFDDSVRTLSFLAKKRSVIFITFEANTRDVVEAFDDKGGDVKKLFTIDSVSIVMGKGSPPIPKLITVYKPDKFNDIEVYTNLFLEQIGKENVCVFMLSVHNLQLYQNEDEIGSFLSVFVRILKEEGIPAVFFIDNSVEFSLQRIILSNVDTAMKITRA